LYLANGSVYRVLDPLRLTPVTLTAAYAQG
jgi:hypothetical protein